MKTLLATAAIVMILISPAWAMKKHEAIGALTSARIYVAKNCPGMRNNEAAQKEALIALGILQTDKASKMQLAEMLAAADATTANLNDMGAPAACALVWGQFGRDGSAVPDLFLRD